MKPSTKKLALLGIAGILLGVSTGANATFVTPSDTPTEALPFDNWARMDAGSTYQQWRGVINGGTPASAGGGVENFTSLYGLNYPDNDLHNPNGSATAQYLDDERNSTEVTSGFLIAGAQNIYSFEASADWELIVPDYGYGPGHSTTVILQLEVSGNEILIGSSTFGNELAPNTVKVDGYDWVDHVELNRNPTVGGGFETYDVTHWFRFELPTNNPSHVIEFDSYDPSLGAFQDLLYGHMSTIALAVDTIARQKALVGDLDLDGFVGITDLNLVLGNWNLDVPPGNAAADPSGDGFVGIADLNTVLGNWNAGTPPPGTQVPEPGTLLVMGAAAVAVLGSRRR